MEWIFQYQQDREKILVMFSRFRQFLIINFLINIKLIINYFNTRYVLPRKDGYT